MEPVQMLWIGPRLSALERLSVASFLANGHPVRLYTYGKVEGVPAGAEVLPGEAIVPGSVVFANPSGFGQGSFAGFSNLFRFQLLFDHGGLWCDIDIVCLRPFELGASRPVVVASERLPPDPGVPPGACQMNGCFLRAPPGNAAIGACLEAAQSADKKRFAWGDLGPRLVTRIFVEHGLQSAALPPEAVCPVDWWNAKELVTAPFEPPAGTAALHCWNEMWRANGLDKDARYAPDSAYESLRRRYGV